jgi:hypothetical protein
MAASVKAFWLAAGVAACGLQAPAVLAKPVLAVRPAPAEKARLLVLTDIEADADDTESLVRLLLYSDVIDIEGIVATTSTHQKTRVAPESILRVIDAYARVQPNLIKHDPAFPTAAGLRTKVTSGRAEYGMAAVGDGKSSDGSRAVIRALDSKDPRPLHISVWGGANTLAQALYDLKKTRSPEDLRRLVARLRVYTISDQDDSGNWIRATFPDLFYIVSPGGYGAATWVGMHEAVDGNDNTTVSNAWLAKNIQQGHGPLGAVYPDVAYGMEGDTPSFLGLIPNGLNVPEHPDQGGWGGRYELYVPKLDDEDLKGFNGGVPIVQETRPIWTNASDTIRRVDANPYGRAHQLGKTTFSGNRVTIWRWRDDFQNDFAARMDWTTRPVAGANHPPVPQLGHPDHITVRSGEAFLLSARGSSDPDGDSLSYLWFQYPEVGTYPGAVEINGAENLYEVHVRAPKVDRPETATFILRVTDKGEPPLSRYRRVTVTFVP